MYKAGRSTLERGLSLPSRILLGSIGALFGGGMIAMAPSSNAPLGFYGFGGFCIAIAVACITTGRARTIVGRTIGACVFCVSAWYVYDMVMVGPLLSQSRAQPSVRNAVLLFVLAGVPALIYAIRGSFTWKRSAD